MADNNMTLRQFRECYLCGDFDGKNAANAGWMSHFCEDDELSERLENIWEVLKGITSDFVLDRFSVEFINLVDSDHDPAYDKIYFKADGTVEPVGKDKLLYVEIGNMNKDFKYEIGMESDDDIESDDDTESVYAGFNDVKYVHMFINNVI